MRAFLLNNSELAWIGYHRDEWIRDHVDWIHGPLISALLLRSVSLIIYGLIQDHATYSYLTQNVKIHYQPFDYCLL